MEKIIQLSKGELQSGSTRVDWAEGLIEQLPATHEGRNSWLMNYGVRKEARSIRARIEKDDAKRHLTPMKLEWDGETCCLKAVDLNP
jgi:hypothetical protein